MIIAIIYKSTRMFTLELVAHHALAYLGGKEVV